MLDYSYHTHTNFSDGQNTVEEMVQQALKLGLKELGISDHLIVHENFTKSPSWKEMKDIRASFMYRESFVEATEHFKKYADEINRVSEKYPLKIYLGAEVDYYNYPGWEDAFRCFKEDVNLDFYISGNHYLPYQNTIIQPDDLDMLVDDLSEQKKLVRKHFSLIRESIESGLFDFVAHIDYMRRVNFCGDNDFLDEKMVIIEALAKTNMATEISTKGIRNYGYFFPADWMIAEMQKHGIPVLITDDAHNIFELGSHFSEAENFLKRLNYKNLWRLPAK